MNAERLSDLIHILEGNNNLQKYLLRAENKEVAEYIRHSVPRETYDKLASTVLALVEKCEKSEQHRQLTHDVRNGLAAVSGYQVLELV